MNPRILVQEMTFGQKDECARTPGWGADEPQYYSLAPYICVYFYKYPLSFFYFTGLLIC